MERLKLLLPVLTFLLGAILTLYLNRRSYGRDLLKDNARELCELTEAWYNEVVAILGDLRKHFDKFFDYSNKERLYAYYNGSLFVSKYRRALETLRHFRSCETLVEFGDEFLDLLAEPRDADAIGLHIANLEIRFGGPEMLKCRPLEQIATSEHRAGSIPAEEKSPGGNSRGNRPLVPESPFLSKLYELVQAIHLEAARLSRRYE